MSQSNNYKQTVPEILLEVFKETFNQGPFKEFREGDPVIFPASMLPALFISEPVTEYDQGGTGHDEIEHQVLIQCVFNKKDEFGAPSGEATLDRTIELTVQGRHPTTGDFLNNTIMGVIRKNITLGNLIINQVGRVEKYVLPRSEDLWTQEAHVRLTITEMQAIANRQ